MNVPIAFAFRLAALAVTLSFATASASAKGADPADRPAELLARYGMIPVKAAGPYVETGTFLIQVTTKLGRPGAKLPDGTWLYQNYGVENSDAHGILVVRFVKGRVNGMALVTPAIATALLAQTISPGECDATKLAEGRSMTLVITSR